jgi:hypothetical protein
MPKRQHLEGLLAPTTDALHLIIGHLFAESTATWTKNQEELDQNSSQRQSLAARLAGILRASIAMVTVGVSRRQT